MREMRWRVLAGSVLLTAAIVIPGCGSDDKASLTESSNKQQYPSTVSNQLASDRQSFSGQVHSRRKACERKRKVVLYRGQGEVIGANQSNRAGKWSVSVSQSSPPSPGGDEYYAHVKSKRSSNYVCSGKRSKKVAVSPVSAPPQGGSEPPPAPPDNGFHPPTPPAPPPPPF